MVSGRMARPSRIAAVHVAASAGAKLHLVQAGGRQRVGARARIHGAAIHGAVAVRGKAEQRVVEDVVVEGGHLADLAHLAGAIAAKGPEPAALGPVSLGVPSHLGRRRARHLAVLPRGDAHHVEVVWVDDGNVGGHGRIKVIVVFIVVIETASGRGRASTRRRRGWLRRPTPHAHLLLP